VFVDFCRRLLADTPGLVFLIVDGHPVHRSNAVEAFAVSTEGRLRLFPARLLARTQPRRVGVEEHQARPGRPQRDRRLADLKHKALTARHRLQKLPHVICGFFQDPNLRYITE
jgi:hypothetical protein